MKAIKPSTERWLLLLILVVAAGLRLYGLNWDAGQHVHPDERWIAMVAPTITWPDRAEDILDPRRSTLNPLWVPDGRGGGAVRNFAYGHLPLYLQSLLGHSLAALGRDLGRGSTTYGQIADQLQSYGTYGGIQLAGRLLSLAFDLGTVYLVFLMGRRIYGPAVGLLAAALVAVAVMHIQLAHFATFDVITTFFITLSVYSSVCVVQSRQQSAWPAMGAGVAAGLAVASKFSAVPLIAVLVVAHLIRAGRQVAPDEHPRLSYILQRSWVEILISLLAALLAFAIASPFAIIDAKLYIKQIVEQGTMVRGVADWPFTRQYRNTTPLVYQVMQQVRWGLWWPLGITAFAGLGWVIVRQFRRLRAEELVLLGWAVPYFGLTSTFMVKFMRYMLPLLPLFILMGAAMLCQLSASAGGWKRRRAEDPLRDAASQNTALPVLPAARYLLLATPYLILLLSLLYALAFMRVYTQTHPWIQSSRWIYTHVPDGSVIAVEHWDDHLPLSLPEQGASLPAHGYRYVELPMYEPDNYAKYDQVRSALDEADYLVLSSNRLYRTIPRLPRRYPISTEFYRLLFEGQLGYVREAEFTAYPGLLGLELRDDDADESFTVYDHPKPLIFRKARDLENAEWDTLFAQALTTPPVWEFQKQWELPSFLARDPPTEQEAERTLLLDRPVGELPQVADFGWNRWASESTVGATLVWWFAVAALGWLAWPLSYVLFRGLRDRGYLLSRSVALLVIGYLVWLPSSLRWLQNGLPLTYGAIALLTLISGALLWQYRSDMRDFVRRKWTLIVMGEIVFGVAYLAFVAIRVLDPDLWQPWNGGEKLMDIAYLNACLRSAYLPPYDPYFSGGYLNYYYYGQFLISIVTRLTGIRATVAFNLAVPLLFALTVSNSFCIGYTLAGRVLGRNDEQRARVGFGVGHGLLAALCVTVLGNLASATQVVERLGRLSPSPFTSQIPGLQALVRAVSGVWQILLYGAQFPGFNYWDPSRVVGLTINEFPYWSFLFADLHPHMINIPFTLLVIAVALNALLRKPAAVRPLAAAEQEPPPNSELALVYASTRYVWRRIDWSKALSWVFWPLALGTLAAVNTWDWPAYAGLSGLVLLFSWLRARGKQGLVPALFASLVLAGGSLALYAPFFKYYTPIYVGLGWSLGRDYTRLGEFLTVWGFFLFVALTFLVVLLTTQRSRWAILRLIRVAGHHLTRLHRMDELYAQLVGRTGVATRLSIAGLVLLVAAAIWWAWKGYWVLALMVPLLALTAALIVQRRMSRERRFVLALIFTVFLLLVGVESFYLKDHLAGDQSGWWRMNTLFKFYMQVWVMLGVAVGGSLPGIWQAVERWGRGRTWAWTLFFGLLFIAAGLYPVLGTPARVVDRFPGERPPIGTLDGMAFMTVGTYTWPSDGDPIHLRGDYDAIRWLQANVPGTPVLAEAPIGYYREFGVRVASLTGFPTLLGMHESEQRYGWQVGERSSKAREFFTTPDTQLTMELARELGIEYVYIGPLERTVYPQSIYKFEQLASDRLLSVAYQNDQVTIYQIVP